MVPPLSVGPAETPSPPSGSNWRSLLGGSGPEFRIGLGRVIVSSFGLAAVYIDPTQPERFVTTAYGLLASYVGFAFLLLLAHRRVAASRILRIGSTIVDIFLVGILSYITGELESPFLIFFIFVLISAAVHWNIKGTLCVAAALQGVLVTVAIPDLQDGEFDANVLIIRSVFCWVLVLLLGYFIAYRNRTISRLGELAQWPHEFVPDVDQPWLAFSLRHAAKVLNARAIAVLWRDPDEVGSHIAVWREGRFRLIEKDGQGTIAETPDASMADWRGQIDYLQRLDALPRLSSAETAAVYHSTISTIRYSGRLFLLPEGPRDNDTAILTRIVTARIAIDLEQHSLVRDYVTAAELKERSRLARDLHDGVLQSLTAAVLELREQERIVPEVSHHVAHIRASLEDQQKRLRQLVDGSFAKQQSACCLADQIGLFVEALEPQWGCMISVEIVPGYLVTTAPIATELCLALSEATANAVKHGRATQLRVKIVDRGERLSLYIADNGNGHLAPELPIPASLAARARELGGDLEVKRGEFGLLLQVSLPATLSKVSLA
ncbi:sensor histidine kinase [Sphingobium lactosutens]|uniref:sensor histidine kinase n=1 Tax=Sphingobium lactosutens TaxID=522773 RepID=UPI001C4CC5F4|nr:histidine kinase [Sphingobium lactosutens]